MGTNIGDLPPPFPNAAQSLSRISNDAQLRERVERASENKPIKTEFPVDTVKVKDANADGASAGGTSAGNSDARSGGNAVDVSV